MGLYFKELGKAQSAKIIKTFHVLYFIKEIHSNGSHRNEINYI